jgi:hypothetical protein
MFSRALDAKINNFPADECKLCKWYHFEYILFKYTDSYVVTISPHPSNLAIMKHNHYIKIVLSNSVKRQCCKYKKTQNGSF